VVRLMRREATRDLTTLRDAMDRLFDESMALTSGSMDPRTSAAPIPLDVYEEGDNLIVKASVPGLKPEELKVSVHDDTLTVSGETKAQEERKDKDFYVRENRYGRFERSVTLPCPVDADQAEAVFENGVLNLTLPKAGEARRKQIPVKTAVASKPPKTGEAQSK
jgi:HSP20 family protein